MSLRSDPGFRPPEDLRPFCCCAELKSAQDKCFRVFVQMQTRGTHSSPMYAGRDKIGWYMEGWPISEGSRFGQALAIMSFPGGLEMSDISVGAPLRLR
jgi:hypothetical protein